MASLSDGKLLEAILLFLEDNSRPNILFGAPAIPLTLLEKQCDLPQGSLTAEKVIQVVEPLLETVFDRPKKGISRTLKRQDRLEYWVVFQASKGPPSDKIPKSRTKAVETQTGPLLPQTTQPILDPASVSKPPQSSGQLQNIAKQDSTGPIPSDNPSLKSVEPNITDLQEAARRKRNRSAPTASFSVPPSPVALPTPLCLPDSVYPLTSRTFDSPMVPTQTRPTAPTPDTGHHLALHVHHPPPLPTPRRPSPPRPLPSAPLPRIINLDPIHPTSHTDNKDPSPQSAVGKGDNQRKRTFLRPFFRKKAAEVKVGNTEIVENVENVENMEGVENAEEVDLRDHEAQGEISEITHDLGTWPTPAHPSAAGTVGEGEKSVPHCLADTPGVLDVSVSREDHSVQTRKAGQLEEESDAPQKSGSLEVVGMEDSGQHLSEVDFGIASKQNPPKTLPSTDQAERSETHKTTDSEPPHLETEYSTLGSGKVEKHRLKGHHRSGDDPKRSIGKNKEDKDSTRLKRSKSSDEHEKARERGHGDREKRHGSLESKSESRVKERRRWRREQDPVSFLSQAIQGLPFAPDTKVLYSFDWIAQRWRLLAAEMIVVLALASVIQISGL